MRKRINSLNSHTGIKTDIILLVRSFARAALLMSFPDFSFPNLPYRKHVTQVQERVISSRTLFVKFASVGEFSSRTSSETRRRDFKERTRDKCRARILPLSLPFISYHLFRLPSLLTPADLAAVEKLISIFQDTGVP